MQDTLYWIWAELVNCNRNDVVVISFGSIVEREKGEYIQYLGRKWRVTDCYPA